ncbi:MAG: hypothetical protein ACHQ0J_04990 [Candidatus Dormibacterales bacterium]
MPKLDDETAGKVKRADGPFEPPPLLQPGLYPGTLLRVSVCTSQYHRGCSWDWDFDLGDRRLVYYTKLGRYPDDQESYWLRRLKEVFAAFGASTEADTDDLVGRSVRLRVSQRKDQYGHTDNRIERVLPLDS